EQARRLAETEVPLPFEGHHQLLLIRFVGQVFEDHLVEAALDGRRRLGARLLRAGQLGLGEDRHLDGRAAAQARGGERGEPLVELAVADGRDHRPVLLVHQRHDRLLAVPLREQARVARLLARDHLSADVDEALDEGIRGPLVFRLDVEDHVAVLHVGVVAGDHARRAGATETGGAGWILRTAPRGIKAPAPGPAAARSPISFRTLPRAAVWTYDRSGPPSSAVPPRRHRRDTEPIGRPGKPGRLPRSERWAGARPPFRPAGPVPAPVRTGTR